MPSTPLPSSAAVYSTPATATVASSPLPSTHLHHLRVAAVDLAAVVLLLEVGDCNQAAALAHVHAVGVRLVKQALLEEGGTAATAGGSESGGGSMGR